MKNLIIVGAGGFGREVLQWAKECPAYRKEWDVDGFLDDRSDALQSVGGINLPILGDTLSFLPRKEHLFIIAVGNPMDKANIRKRLIEKGAEFTRIIHSSCIVGRKVELEPGTILCPGVTLTCDIHIGANTALNINSAVGHDAVIGDDCQLSSFCDITGNVQVGNRVFMGSRASIIPGRKVGNDSIVGAGSVVISDVPEKVTVFGNPATILKRHA